MEAWFPPFVQDFTENTRSRCSASLLITLCTNLKACYIENTMVGIITLVLVALAIYLVFFVFFPLGRGAIYDPSSYEETRLMADLAEIAPGEKAADLGSGDGRVLIALAQRGAEAHGYEVNPVLVAIARRNIRSQGLQGKAFVHWGNFWRQESLALRSDHRVPGGIRHGQARGQAPQGAAKGSAHCLALLALPEPSARADAEKRLSIQDRLKAG